MDWPDGADKLAESFAELSLERTITKGLKSAEEIDRLTVDEKLGDIERAVYLLSSGQEVQRISVIKSLPQLLRDHNADCMKRVVPKVKEVLHVAGSDVQVAATQAFLTIIENQIVSYPVFAQTFLQSMLQSIDNRDPALRQKRKEQELEAIAYSWLETLLEVISFLPKDIIKKEILTITISKGQLSQSVHSRLASCKILGRVATKFDSFMIKKEILPLVTSLCQDVDYEVRGCMCRQLDAVARGLGLESTKSAILPELVELSNDEESFVRLAALETVVSLLSLLDDETCVNTIIPLMCRFCENALQNEDPTLPSVAHQFGRLCHGLSVNLNEDQKIWFLDFYRRMCVLGLTEGKSKSSDRMTPNLLNIFEEEDSYAECRQCAGYNFPCMVLFAGPRNFKTELYSTFSSLCDDPHRLVRRTVACGFHEVAKLLGSSVLMIQQELINLLKDDSPEVLEGLVPHVPETLEMFAKGGGNVVTESKLTGLADLVPALMAAESQAACSRRWRLHRDLITQFECLPKCLTSDQIYYKFLPVLFKHLTTNRVLPVKLAAARTICVFIRHNRKLEQRQELCCRLIEECCHGNSSWKRILFMDICKILMEMFSKMFFKEYFYEFVLELAQDPVANVRLKFCHLLPALKKQIKLPTDRPLLQQLELMVRRLMAHEKDRDVAERIRHSVLELDKIQIGMDSGTNRFYMDDDLADQRKEEEERLLIELEEKEKEEAEKSMKNPSSAKVGGRKKSNEDGKLTKKGSKPAKSSNVSGKKAGQSNSNSSLLPGPPPHLSSSKGNKTMKSLSSAKSSKTGKNSPIGDASSLSSSSSIRPRSRGGSDGNIVGLKATPTRPRKGSDGSAAQATAHNVVKRLYNESTSGHSSKKSSSSSRKSSATTTSSASSTSTDGKPRRKISKS
ncbi:serine/threonine-protein phosphatase 4 regulatory subunit 4-like isoform X3 [Ptychodera flava]|uniref:serine/threonine-protein phosphatase 4 regulatory subunit 4-like isoform X3 n=1 Tax=Ptychodera flava TaxID=63121 RepID=UPI00396A6091